MRTHRTFAALVVCAYVSWAVPAAAADAVVYWNEVTANAVTAGARGPAGLLDFAKVHIAIHDAVQAFDHRFEPYCTRIENASGSPAAAVAKAARDVLVALFPAQQAAIDATYQAYLLANGLIGDAGINVGEQAAAAILALRADDGAWPTPAPTFFGGTEPGEWRPTTTPPTSMAVPWQGVVVPFTLKDATQLRPSPGPPALTSGLYTRDYNEVKDIGAKFSTVRTSEQTDLAHFYSDNFIALWERTLRTISTTYITDLGDSARLFALAHMASADAGIAAWNTKLYWNFWRPITAIREGDNDGNPQTVGDALWEPLITTPNYPDYTSGANNLTSSMARILEHVFGTDHVTFMIESKAPLAIVKFRTYDRLSDVCRDVIDVRVYQGIHFRFADEVAFRTGRRAADWVFSHFLRATND